ncbi:MAG: alpha/beta hydrolase, partial [Rhizobiales bacterium 17-65-6]
LIATPPVDRLAVLDIVPTLAMWHGMDRARALQVYHWAFLAQPHPFPETVIGQDAVYFLDWTLASWTAAKDLSAFAPEALAQYRASFLQPNRLRAACEDYRAGATIDLAHDEADRAQGRLIQCPVRVLWGDHGIPGRGTSPLDAWKVFAPQAEGQPVAGGHFLPEESPEAVAAALDGFF